MYQALVQSQESLKFCPNITSIAPQRHDDFAVVIFHLKHFAGFKDKATGTRGSPLLGRVVFFLSLSHNVASECDITTCIKTDKPLVGLHILVTLRYDVKGNVTCIW